jgi:hypothetical protein
MKKKGVLVNTMLSAALFCTCMMVAQEPVQNIDGSRHPNLAEAQHLIAKANGFITNAQKDNRYDMHGHASKARELLVQANDELKRAAEDANERR